MRSFFPRACSYTQFLELARQACFHAFLLAQCRCSLSEKTGHYHIDPKKLPVCHNLRISSYGIFEGVASRGKGSTGWFFGLKRHPVVNEHGQLVRPLLTPANVADNNRQVLNYLFEGLQRKCYGDRG
ncbi:DDE family transposase [Pontibacter ummariensis]|uniref:Transposase DDE domain-containing protein n=1 Tax=Pontibacter ummariensis TaxID=1610492 RepID=A0A239CDY3_9BACT|nr:transposase [Pontibacter ummariensis]PRY15072.1 DDE family transposase [Pontibacter ummariensis]SNS18300.1 Transposase DDE domain-containing protein [Pontibacter ummariensis]